MILFFSTIHFLSKSCHGHKKPFSITGHKSERIAKRISRAGICSRRDAELYIRTGRVKLNGVTIRTPALNVDLNDRILVDDISIPKPKPKTLWRYNKPRGLVVTRRDERNRPTIFENLPSHLPRLLTVGRLDLDLRVIVND